MVKISAERKRAIAQAWLDMTLCTYPSQSVQFMLNERDRFRNPVGQALKDGIPVLINELLDETDSERARQALEDIVRIRAVQNFPPESRGIHFPAEKNLQPGIAGRQQGVPGVGQTSR